LRSASKPCMPAALHETDEIEVNALQAQTPGLDLGKSRMSLISASKAPGLAIKRKGVPSSDRPRPGVSRHVRAPGSHSAACGFHGSGCRKRIWRVCDLGLFLARNSFFSARRRSSISFCKLALAVPGPGSLTHVAFELLCEYMSRSTLFRWSRRGDPVSRDLAFFHLRPGYRSFPARRFPVI